MKISTRILALGVALLASAGLIAMSLTSARSLQGQETAPQGVVPTTLVRLDPATQTVTAGEDVTVDVRVDDVTNLGTFEFALTFDPGVLSYVSFGSGPFLASTGRSVVCFPPLLDKDGDTVADAGYVRPGCVTFNPPPPDGPTGSGLLGTLTFSTSCAGSSDLAFWQDGGDPLVNLGNPLAEDIPTQSQGASVTVTGSPLCPGTTPTPSALIGDVDCNRTINAIDALFILQFFAAIINSLPCPDAADVNLNGNTDAIDAALILQFAAGLIDTLPP